MATMQTQSMLWPEPAGLESINSPGLLVDPDRIAANVARMISIVGGPENVGRLRPHVKTHKMPDAIHVQLDAGITKFKTATLTETEMAATAGAAEVLLAHQPVGPKIDRLIGLVQRFSETSIACVVDDPVVVKALSDGLSRTTHQIDLLIDIDCGMHRTGIMLGDRVEQLRRLIESSPHVSFAGLHVYDGHIHDASIDDRRRAVAPVIDAIREYTQSRGETTIIAGGTPTFPMWAADTPWECSPGTPILWDIGYGGDYDDLPFEIAAALLTRIVSKPGDGMLCFDLGHKSIAAEMPLDRRLILSKIDDAVFVGQSEEHLVVSTPRASEYSVGDAMLAFPRHICPTVARYPEAHVIQNATVTGEKWLIAARDHECLVNG